MKSNNRTDRKNPYIKLDFNFNNKIKIYTISKYTITQQTTIKLPCKTPLKNLLLFKNIACNYIYCFRNPIKLLKRLLTLQLMKFSFFKVTNITTIGLKIIHCNDVVFN